MEGTVASVPPQGGRKHPQQEFLQVDTTNILFICGGAFAGLDKIISNRGQGTASVSVPTCATPTTARLEKFCEMSSRRICSEIRLIPEFVGRLPVIATLEDLDEDALVQILTKPKNALVKQYGRLFEMEDVKLNSPRGRTLRHRQQGDQARDRARAACGQSWRAFCSRLCTSCPAWKAWRRSRSTAKSSKAGRSLSISMRTTAGTKAAPPHDPLGLDLAPAKSI